MAAELVELTVTGSRPQADFIVSQLRSLGIEAFSKGDYEGSAWVMGDVHVFVAIHDEERAIAALATNQALEADPGHWIDPGRRRRRGLVLLVCYVIAPLTMAMMVIIAQLTR